MTADGSEIAVSDGSDAGPVARQPVTRIRTSRAARGQVGPAAGIGDSSRRGVRQAGPKNPPGPRGGRTRHTRGPRHRQSEAAVNTSRLDHELPDSKQAYSGQTRQVQRLRGRAASLEGLHDGRAGPACGAGLRKGQSSP